MRRQISAAAGAFGAALSWATNLRRLGAGTVDNPATWIDLALLAVVLLCSVYALAPRHLRFWERWEYPFDVPIADAIRCLIAATPEHGWPSDGSADSHVFVKVLYPPMCDGDLSVAGSGGDFEKLRPISSTQCLSLTPAVGLVPGGRVAHLLRSAEMRDDRPLEVHRNLHVRSVDLYRLWPHAKQPAQPLRNHGI